MSADTVIDFFVNDDGLWSTRDPGYGRTDADIQPLRIKGRGWQQHQAWQLGIDADLPQCLERIASSGTLTDRAHAVLELTAAAVSVAHAHAIVPTIGDDDWIWLPAPTAPLAKELSDAEEAAITADVFITRGTTINHAAGDWLDYTCDVINAVTPTPAPPLTGESPSSHAIAKYRRWAALVAARAAVNGRLAIRIDEPDYSTDDWTLTPLLIALDSPTTRYTPDDAERHATDHGALARVWQQWRHAEVINAKQVFAQASTVGQFAILNLTSEGVTPDELIEFLDKSAGKLADVGVDILAPANLTRHAQLRRRVTGFSPPSLGLLTMSELPLTRLVTIDGVELTNTEVADLMIQKSELVSVRGRWMRLDDKDREKLERFLIATDRPDTTATDLLADDTLDDDIEWDTPDFTHLTTGRAITVPGTVHATLRPYQHTGVEWLTWLEDHHVGGVLADDMGLGKTLQVLTRISMDHPAPTLIVCPVTLIDTWIRQAAQFTPTLRVRAHYGPNRPSTPTAVINDVDVVITTYGLLARDPALADIDWHRVVLDEAQAVKNPTTRAAVAARKLTATHRLAVTGTPVENHVGDLWSLMAFTTPGLLPSRRAFNKKFLTADPDTPTATRNLGPLRALTAPFILRRLKTDPGIAPDLPDRTMVRDDCTLTKEQLGAYEAAVAAMLKALTRKQDDGDDDGPPRMKRRAAVLDGIARLKQICVHPALLTETRDQLHGRSGKVDRLVDLCQEITDEGQAVVVFTQFASFAAPLARHLSDMLNVDVVTLTGADSRTQRTRVVDAFSRTDGPPILVASLKAGGTGLTLTRANHVIHLDSWWNPAVQDQASDRVWRIGQNQKVIVHTLVCPGTLEDKIDDMLTAKKNIANSVIQSTDTAVTEMTTDQLTALITLTRSRVMT